MILSLPKKPVITPQVISWIIASGALISSLFVPYIEIKFTLIAIGVSIFWASILTVIACPNYNGSFNFVMGTSIGFIVSLPIGQIVQDLRPGYLWAWVLILGWAIGGYLSVRDQVIASDDVLDSPIATGFAILGILMAVLIGVLVVSFIVSIVLSIFGISLPYLYSIIISFLIINMTLVEYLEKKIFSEDLKKLEYIPNIRGTFGMFLGGVNGLMWSLVIGSLLVQRVGLSMNGFWRGAYSALIVGMLVGFYFGYKIEKGLEDNIVKKDR